MPPPVPDPLHWLIVAGDAVAEPEMLLTTLTLQLTVPPPPLPEPLHTKIEVVSSGKEVVVVVHGSTVLAAPWHSFTVTTEPAAPLVRSRLLVTVMSHCTAWPPALSLPAHCVVERVEAAALPTAGDTACTTTKRKPSATSEARISSMERRFPPSDEPA